MESLVQLAYIGPGLSGGALTLIFCVLSAIFYGFFSFIWYPLKSFIKFIKNKLGF